MLISLRPEIVLNESSRFSPPQMPIPGSYVPRRLKSSTLSLKSLKITLRLTVVCCETVRMSSAHWSTYCWQFKKKWRTFPMAPRRQKGGISPYLERYNLFVSGGEGSDDAFFNKRNILAQQQKLFFFASIQECPNRLLHKELDMYMHKLFVCLFDLRLFGFVCFLFHLVSGKGCGLWLWHSLDCSLTFVLVVPVTILIVSFFF